jgi:hypothetical protein
VVQTNVTTTDIKTFIDSRKREIETQQEIIKQAQARIDCILEELSKLIT